MELFLTSILGGMGMDDDGRPIACEVDNRNGLADALRAVIPKGAKCLIFASSPDSFDINDMVVELSREGFGRSGLELSDVVMCDRRNADKAGELLEQSGFVVLSGGHVPTQNRFFADLGLAALLNGYDGVIAGISAGTMNSADVVYAQPELEGEQTDPGYERYPKGLGLTRINILPHFQYIRTLTLDGFRVLEDISLPDSKIRPFYALNDGSFVHASRKGSVLYGEAYYLCRGEMRQVCSAGERFVIE